MIRVLHLITSFGIGGGAESNLSRLVRHMDKRRFSNTVVAMTDGHRIDQGLWKMQLGQAGVPFHSLGMRRGVPDPLAVTRLLRIVRQVRPVVLQTWLYHADLLGLLVGRLARVPVILWNIRCSFHEMGHYRRLSAVVLRTLVKLSPLPDAVLTNSHAGRKFHEGLGYRPRKWVWIPNSLDLEQFRPDLSARTRLRREIGVPDDVLLVGLVARFDPMKDHATFVAAANLLADYSPNAHYVLLGPNIDSDNIRLNRLIAATGIADRFHLLGLRRDISYVTAGLDVACSSSYGEGSPNAVTEAMACGVPCVVTDVGDSAFLLGNCGKVVPPSDPASFAQACRELLDVSLAHRLQIGLNARKRIEEHFSLDSVVARYEQLYEGTAPRLEAGTLQ